jgi:calnexin
LYKNEIFYSQGAVGFELWTMSDDILFDNLLITDSLITAEQWSADSFDIKTIKLDKQAVSQFFNIFQM